MSGAARVFLTLDELAEFLRLPVGHRLHAVDELPAGHCPGVSLTIVSQEDATGKLPRFKAADPLMVMDLATYRRWISDTGVVTRTSLREVETEPRWVTGDRQDERQRRPGRRADEPYTPVTPPVTASPNGTWPTFPGERMDYTGTGADPGDEDGHMGGPR